MRRALQAAAVLVGGFATVCLAASVPAWLDEAISKWNAAHPEAQVRFVNIKDSFVWYDMAKGGDVGHTMIRERINKIVLDRGYSPVDDEERVTTARPPAKEGPSSAKKCWSRSFVLDIKAQGDTKAVGEESPGQRQRMLTSMVCEDTATWWAGFRVAS